MMRGYSERVSIIKALAISIIGLVAICLCILPGGYAEGSELSAGIALSANGDSGGGTEDSPIAEGTWGTCSWEISASGVLTVHPGQGESQEGKSSSPWNEYSGSITAIAFAAEGGAKVVAPVDSSRLLQGLSKVTSIDFSGFDSSHVENMSRMLSGLWVLESVDISPLDTSNVVNMSSLFSGSSALETVGLSSLETSKVTDMSYMFANCYALSSLDLSGLDVSKVTNMSSLFYNCPELAEVNLDGIDTSAVTSMRMMFAGCTSLATLDVTPLSTENVTDMMGMFVNCSSLPAVNLSGFDTSKVESMDSMFAGCSSLTGLDLSCLNASGVKSMNLMFDECLSLEAVNLTGLDTSNVTNMSFMFAMCPSLASLDLSSFDTSQVTKMDHMFVGCSALGTILVGDDWTTEGVTDSADHQKGFFQGCCSLVGGQGTAYNPEDYGMSYARVDAEGSQGYLTDVHAINLTIDAISDQPFTGAEIEPTVRVTYQGSELADTDYEVVCANNRSPGMATVAVFGKGNYSGHAARATFRIVSNGGIVATGQWGTCPWEIDATGTLTVHPGTIEQDRMSAPQYYIDDWMAMPVVADCTFWRAYQGKVKRIVLKGEGEQKVIAPNDSSGLFESFSNVETMDLEGIDISAAQDLSRMFSGCSSLETIYVSSSWALNADGCNHSDMFRGCESLVGGNGTAYDQAHVDGEYARIDAAGAPGYLTEAPVPSKPSVADADVAPIPAQTYTGSRIEPALEVSYGGRPLVLGVDYEVAYSGNVDAGTATATLTGIGAYAGSRTVEFVIAKAASAVRLAGQTVTYNGRVRAYSGKVTRSGSSGKVSFSYYSDAKCTKAVKATAVKGAGTYYVRATLAADANHEGATSAAAKLVIAKAANTLTVKAKSPALKAGGSLAASKVVAVSKAKGKASYKKVSGNKKIAVASNGRLTAKKGLAKGTYKVKVKVTAKGNANYKAGSKTVAVKVRVK